MTNTMAIRSSHAASLHNFSNVILGSLYELNKHLNKGGGQFDIYHT
jgi:hypothetical protein